MLHRWPYFKPTLQAGASHCRDFASFSNYLKEYCTDQWIPVLKQPFKFVLFKILYTFENKSLVLYILVWVVGDEAVKKLTEAKNYNLTRFRDLVKYIYVSLW